MRARTATRKRVVNMDALNETRTENKNTDERLSKNATERDRKKMKASP